MRRRFTPMSASTNTPMSSEGWAAESFDALSNGRTMRACEKSVPSAKLDSIVNTVENISGVPEREAPPARLRNDHAAVEGVDKVAYVRFASVYLEFEDVSEFMHELKHLVRSRASGAGKKA